MKARDAARFALAWSSSVVLVLGALLVPATLSKESFGAVAQVTSDPGIFVDRALYSDSQGVVFAAGTDALATRLP